MSYDPEAAFLTRLAAGTPLPGGGSAAAYAGAMAAALVAMVSRLTVGKKSYVDVEGRMMEIASKAEVLRSELEALVKTDEEAFAGILKSRRMPKETEAQVKARAEAIEKATHQAALVPLQTAKKILSVMELAVEVVETGLASAIADAASATLMGRAALQSAGLNVKTNASSMEDKAAAQKWLGELAELDAKAAALVSRADAALQSRANLSI